MLEVSENSIVSCLGPINSLWIIFLFSFPFLSLLVGDLGFRRQNYFSITSRLPPKSSRHDYKRENYDWQNVGGKGREVSYDPQIFEFLTC